MLNPSFDTALLSRIEDASLNASAPPQQRWMDGWLLRLCPGKAKRARCINAVAAGRLPLADKLAWSEAAYREADLPLFLRLTPFSQPGNLDAQLADLGYHRIDDTRVMVSTDFADPGPIALPPRCKLQRIDLEAFALQVGELRGSPLDQRRAHAQRLGGSPVPYTAMSIVRDGRVLACGQMAIENDVVGLYDVHTAAPERGHGLARALCLHLLAAARQQGTRHAYLQVEHDNLPARAVYTRLGFSDAYAYHYRSPQPTDRMVAHPDVSARTNRI